MAFRLISIFGGVGLACYLALVGFEARDEATRKVLIEKSFGDDINDDTRKKKMFMNVLQSAAYGGKPMYRQTKEEIENSLRRH